MIGLHSVGIIMRPWLRYFLIDMAKKFKENHGVKVHAYCLTKGEKKFYDQENTEGVFETVNYCGMLYDEAARSDLDHDEVLQKARDFEKMSGATMNSVAMPDKHFGRPYVLGGPLFPKSNISNNTSYEQMLHGYNSVFSFWENEIDSKKIGLIINGPKEVAKIAEAKGVLYRIHMTSCFEDYQYWGWDDHYANPMFNREFDSTEPGSIQEYDIADPYRDVVINISNVIKINGNVYELLKNLTRTAKNHLLAKLRNRDMQYFLHEELAYHYRRWRDLRLLSGPKYHTLEDIKGLDYVFYPLHREPETPFMRMAPNHLSQLTTIASLSRDLPAGVKLVVKEHVPAIGRRPLMFYKQLEEFKNVIILNIRERGLDVVKHSRAVSTICGTAGFEAAVMGYPVITFGKFNIYNCVPHVQVIEKDDDIKPAFDRVFNGGFDKKQMKADGAKLIEVIKKNSFSWAGYDRASLTGYNERHVQDTFEKLIESIEQERAMNKEV